LPRGIQEYIRYGQRRGVSKTFKCRTRKPWYSVPHVHLPDAFLTYMSGDTPRLVANDAGVYAPNSLHVLRLHTQSRVTSDALAAIWFTSLTRLSTEIEGHPLGGGLLKLEPTEAENVIVPYPEKSNGELTDLARELDAMVREGSLDEARARADRVVLKGYLGLDDKDILTLRNAASYLNQRRKSRSNAR
jgi:hypothetical protein